MSGTPYYEYNSIQPEVQTPKINHLQLIYASNNIHAKIYYNDGTIEIVSQDRITQQVHDDHIYVHPTPGYTD